MPTNYSTNVGRYLSEGGSDRNFLLTNQMMTGGPPPTLFRGVVIDVIADPALLTQDEIESIGNLVDNGEFVPIMTPNTCIVKIISGNQADANWNTIVFPFWSSHIMTPIAPGEQVYIIYEDFAGSNQKVGFWMTRVHGYNTFEDVNYTHFDRRFDLTTNPLNYSTSGSANRPTDVVPERFPNGTNTINGATLPYGNDPSQNPYDIIFNTAQATQYITPEPVPRWKKRPQELILQGANNSLIMLGEDRNGPVSGAIQENPVDITVENKAARQAGAIDIVVGRGRYFQPVGEDPKGGDTVSNPAGANSTAPLVNSNIREYLETDKNPYRSTRENIANPLEGDPDPIYDAARIYVVQQSRVDENYRLVPDVDNGLEYPVGALANEQPAGTGVLGRSYVVSKADNIRLIARREPVSAEAGEENIAGTILIVREGVKNSYTPTDGVEQESDPDGSLAYIYFNQEGKIQIDANRIYLGQATGEAQPYIRYAAYKYTIEKLQKEIHAVREYADLIRSTIAEGITGATDSLGVPIAKLTSLRLELGVKGREKPEDAQLDIAKAQSKKVFGE